MKTFTKIVRENKAIFGAALIAVVLSLLVFLKVKDEVTRFTLIMPLFAGFILFSILITADEDLDEEKGKKTAKK
ncbi:MAG: hypothetical protein UT63_C0017G0010 [Candidatus Gottesmanbacteria bacterium GW2011_GWC2_39_8]|uniref:Uncharacterized protein n=1 Tax=Candidatus Gottesmanbacteria bacterium GW2011_GWC2_39_8 TaxID=1618450 RepID=A0A0G0PZ56_9BACT|nr:MAG: hypothetical protein UT63_C0017G0010 [Candidatus Gottesmanbacteria bacterium GW2011_GWC2_39_8]